MGQEHVNSPGKQAWAGVPPLQPIPDSIQSLGTAFARTMAKQPNALAFADSTKTKLSYRQTMQRATALARVLGRTVGPGRYVGILLPPTVAAAVTNLAVTLLGKIPVNLNYTVSESVVNSCIDQCELSHVISSRRALEKFPIKPKVPVILLEDVPKLISRLDKLVAAVASYSPKLLAPAFLPGLRGNRMEETATVIFTSGSTGDPKGVMLSHRNVLSNVFGIGQHVDLSPKDTVLGILPFFHSFGFTVTLWTVLGQGLKAVYHFSPLDAKIIGGLSEEFGATVMAATPTFMRSYMQRCKPEQFAKLRLLILGAEKLKPETAQEIEDRLKVIPLEGYGCSETGPVVSVNVPVSVRSRSGESIPGNRRGTVGRPLPGTEVRTVDVQTGALLPVGQEGIIEVRGPQIMQGYLNRAEATSAVLRDGWYSTGDLGFVDQDGFLSITDRLSRFAKIGGEMVPHHAVESAIAQVAGVSDASLVVTSVPDPKRGERLVVLHTGLPLTPEATCARLTAGSTPKLWLPAPSDFIQVESIPVLGTGKLDLREIRRVAIERSGGTAPA